MKAGRRVLVLRTFSKIYGLAGLRVGYGIGPTDVIEAIGKTRRAFDVNTQAQVAALASIDAPDELAERRRLTHEGRQQLERTLREHGLEPAGPAVANFLFVEVGEDARPLFEALLRQGAIVRPMGGFGAPGALRITVGTPDENAFFAEALASRAGRDDLDVGYPRHSRVRSGPRFPYADNVEERHRSRCDRRSQRTARAAARRALSDHHVPPAGASQTVGLGDVPHDPRLGVRGLARRRRLGSPAGRISGSTRASPQSSPRRRREGRREAPRHRPGRPARDGPRHRLRQARERGQGRPVALRHDHARPGRPGHQVRVAALVPARPLRQDLLPGQDDLQRAHQRRLLGVRHEGNARDRPEADRGSRSTT